MKVAEWSNDWYWNHGIDDISVQIQSRGKLQIWRYASYARYIADHVWPLVHRETQFGRLEMASEVCCRSLVLYLIGGDWNMTGLFSHILKIVIAMDFHICQRDWNHQPGTGGPNKMEVEAPLFAWTRPKVSISKRHEESLSTHVPRSDWVPDKWCVSVQMSLSEARIPKSPGLIISFSLKKLPIRGIYHISIYIYIPCASTRAHHVHLVTYPMICPLNPIESLGWWPRRDTWWCSVALASPPVQESRISGWMIDGKMPGNWWSSI